MKAWSEKKISIIAIVISVISGYFSLKIGYDSLQQEKINTKLQKKNTEIQKKLRSEQRADKYKSYAGALDTIVSFEKQYDKKYASKLQNINTETNSKKIKNLSKYFSNNPLHKELWGNFGYNSLNLDNIEEDLSAQKNIITAMKNVQKDKHNEIKEKDLRYSQAIFKKFLMPNHNKEPLGNVVHEEQKNKEYSWDQNHSFLNSKWEPRGEMPINFFNDSEVSSLRHCFSLEKRSKILTCLSNTAKKLLKNK